MTFTFINQYYHQYWTSLFSLFLYYLGQALNQKYLWKWEEIVREKHKIDGKLSPADCQFQKQIAYHWNAVELKCYLKGNLMQIIWKMWEFNLRLLLRYKLLTLLYNQDINVLLKQNHLFVCSFICTYLFFRNLPIFLITALLNI